MCESLYPDIRPTGRYYQLKSFLTPAVGKWAVLTACGWGTGDDLPVGSGQFKLELVGAYVAENLEAISVYRTALMGVEAEAPTPWPIVSLRMLLEVMDYPSVEPFKLMVKGTMEDKNLVLTLRG